MKKQRQSSSRQGPIQLSANKKSHSINLKTKQQPLFAPYKIEWKTPTNDNLLFSVNQSVPLKQPFKNIENNHANNQFGNNGNINNNSKAFYQNMKNQLMNIKQDVEKLISKQKKTPSNSKDQDNTGSDSHSITEHQNSNGCIKTISIKNKCQQKANKIENLYENVDKVLANKMGDHNSVSSKFTVGQSRFDYPAMHNFIQDQMKNACTLQTKYRSEKDTYVRTKSKSIAQNFSKGFALDLLHARHDSRENKVSIGSSLKYLANEQNQNQEEEDNEPVRQKLEVDIKLPSFDKVKNEDKAMQQQKNNLISTLQKQLNELEKELSLRDELMSRKQQCKFQLTEEVQKVKKQLQLQKQTNQQLLRKNEHQVIHLRNINQQNENRTKFYEQELQKAIHAIRQKEQQNFNLSENLNAQNFTIQELSNTCQKLSIQVRQMKQSHEESKNIKEKMKLKENQLYIYQEELKQAKSKIRELKQSLSENQSSLPPTFTQTRYKSTEQQQQALEESSKLNWELKECRKLNQNFKTQNDRLKRQFNSINQMNSENQSKITQLIKENTELKVKVAEFQRDSQKAVQQLMNSPDFQNIGNQISKKLSSMVEQNYQLKNKISHLESNIQEITTKNGLLREQLKMYMQKASVFKDCTRRLKVEDWDNLTQERDNLKSQLQSVKIRLDQTKQFYELQTMRKQNQIYELKEQIEQMIDIQSQNEETFHPNVRSVKHIKNLGTLLTQFKDMIEYNLELKEEITQLQR